MALDIKNWAIDAIRVKVNGNSVENHLPVRYVNQAISDDESIFMLGFDFEYLGQFDKAIMSLWEKEERPEFDRKKPKANRLTNSPKEIEVELIQIDHIGRPQAVKTFKSKVKEYRRYSRIGEPYFARLIIQDAKKEKKKSNQAPVYYGA